MLPEGCSGSHKLLYLHDVSRHVKQTEAYFLTLDNNNSGCELALFMETDQSYGMAQNES